MTFKFYGETVSLTIFQIETTPIIIPIIPIPIAKIRKFFFSFIFYFNEYTLIIDKVPSIASSSLTVSVAWLGKKLRTLEFCKLLIFPPNI